MAKNEGAGPRGSPYIIPTVLTVTHSLDVANLKPNGDHDRIQTTSLQQMGRSFKRSSDLYLAVIKDRHRVLTLGFSLKNTHKTRKRTDELETLHSEYMDFWSCDKRPKNALSPCKSCRGPRISAQCSENALGRMEKSCEAGLKLGS